MIEDVKATETSAILTSSLINHIFHFFMNDSLPNHDIVLLGAGHTHAHIIRRWRMEPIPQTRLTCLSDHTIATYSGMMAGTLAGLYEPSEMQIDLVRLCASCGVRFVHGKVVGHDVGGRRLLLEDRPAVHYDLLSVGIGSRPMLPPGGEAGLSIKPMQTFLNRLSTAIDNRCAQHPQETLQVAIVGGGAAGVEIACCLQQHFENRYPEIAAPSITIIDADEHLLAGMPPRTRLLATREIQRRGIQLRLNARIARVRGERQILFEDGQQWQPDFILWATSAMPPPLLDQLELPLDTHRFLQTSSTLQCTGYEHVFAVGDSGTVQGESYAKAGVFAVRQGPLLWENLRRKIRGEPLRDWKPQSHFLTLINTGDRRALLTYWGLSFHARWCWWLKDWIDTKFMAMVQSYKPPEMMDTPADDTGAIALAKQCGGCGSKTSARVLQQILPALQQVQYDHVLIGLDQPDDIALLAPRAGLATAVSTDFFSAFVDDPYLLGRIAALNSLSDLFAKGATPRAALSIAVLPAGSDEQQARLLHDLSAGAMREFQPVDVPIIGGHSIMGPKLTFGFTILGDADPESIMRKSNLAQGDRLVLTKPLGSGVLLAAHMQAACHEQWWTPLVETMLLSNQHAAAVAMELNISAATDVTGFGLAGHLLEMLKLSGLSAELSLSALPLLSGAAELLQGGLESTLAPSNRENCCGLEASPRTLLKASSGRVSQHSRAALGCAVNFSAELQESSLTKILFDPQTSGGLLLAVPENRLDELLSKCGTQVAEIGRIVEDDGNGSPLSIVL